MPKTFSWKAVEIRAIAFSHYCFFLSLCQYIPVVQHALMETYALYPCICKPAYSTIITWCFPTSPFRLLSLNPLYNYINELPDWLNLCFLKALSGTPVLERTVHPKQLSKWTFSFPLCLTVLPARSLHQHCFFLLAMTNSDHISNFAHINPLSKATSEIELLETLPQWS